MVWRGYEIIIKALKSPRTSNYVACVRVYCIHLYVVCGHVHAVYYTRRVLFEGVAFAAISRSSDITSARGISLHKIHTRIHTHASLNKIMPSLRLFCVCMCIACAVTAARATDRACCVADDARRDDGDDVVSRVPCVLLITFVEIVFRAPNVCQTKKRNRNAVRSDVSMR